MKDPRVEGFAACVAGFDIETCPYPIIHQSRPRWRAGWRDADELKEFGKVSMVHVREYAKEVPKPAVQGA